MESPCRMVSCMFYLMLLSALVISPSPSPDSLFLLCLYLFGGAHSVIRWEKRILFFFFVTLLFSWISYLTWLTVQPTNSYYCKTESSTETDIHIWKQELHMLLLLPEKTYQEPCPQWLLNLRARPLSYLEQLFVRKSVQFCSKSKIVA